MADGRADGTDGEAPGESSGGVGGIGRGLLVPEVGDADTRPLEAHIQWVQTVPRESRHELDAALRERASKEISAGHRDATFLGPEPDSIALSLARLACLRQA